ncbi:MAG TPA: 4'-phosphopantetheinyl transferase superfamily protein [Streptosporangiaceae bacterium]|nr:4'-phosphopantetheinyl transferase superfamily protein [Streptosporangiaceae bacterium]
MIDRILPPAAVAAESFGALPEPGADLFPAEQQAVRTAGPERQAEFTAGRRCARTALAGLGVPAAPILPGPAGEPGWPPGVTGSITHCPGYRACAVARTEDLAAIGIDAEPDEELPPELTGAVATAWERTWIQRQAAAGTPGPVVHWARLVFSAKEAAAKAWYPLAARWPDLAELTVAATGAATGAGTGAGGLIVRLTGAAPGLPATLAGRWLARDGLIITVVAGDPLRPPAVAGDPLRPPAVAGPPR